VTREACVIGAGPNGLAAAIVLAQSGLKVNVFEAEPEPGGAVRTLELTLPGFLHDFGSAVYPFAAGSPFFSSLPLSNHGLEWIHSPCPLAHPFDDGTAITLERDLHEAESSLGDDGRAWRRLMQPFVERWSDLSSEVLQPIHLLSRHPLLLARFGLVAFPPAKMLARILFRRERTRALFAGLAAHSLFDGVAIASGFVLSTWLGWVIFIAILLHKLPEGFTVASVMLASGRSRRTALISAAVLAAATVLGVLVINLLPGWVQAGLPLSAGVAIYVAATDLVPEVNREPGIRMALVFFAGVLMFLLLRLLAPGL